MKEKTHCISNVPTLYPQQLNAKCVELNNLSAYLEIDIIIIDCMVGECVGMFRMSLEFCQWWSPSTRFCNIMEKVGTKLKLPEHLCESDDPLTKAKAYSLQLLLLANNIGGKEMTVELVGWLKNLDYSRLNSSLLKYEKQHRRAEKHIPYIRCSLQKHLVGTSESGYKANVQKSSDVSTPLEMDGFLFEDLDEALKNAGMRSDRYCEKCKSGAVTEIATNYVSYSVDSLVNLFGVVLKNCKRSRIAILGSGDGALVYGGLLFSDAEIIVSFEGSEKFRDIQR
ncbi:unnamed protein product [Allacma fusca]|uniref:Uncharacterized protein n=1 Tax=Allacma fusca TaxID=39272 RepID=A0A8J2JZ69_9HEXA|nr:unnamed protein product [Allacma fusca]